MSAANAMSWAEDTTERVRYMVVLVGDLKSASQDIPADKLYRLPTGWAIPGSYEVFLIGAPSASKLTAASVYPPGRIRTGRTATRG